MKDSVQDSDQNLSSQEEGKVGQELEQALLKAQENLEGWQRAVADFENYKRRDEALHQQLLRHGQDQVLLEFIEVVADLDRILMHAPQNTEARDWLVGLENIRKVWMSKLAHFGVERVTTENQTFDPQWHEAIGQVEGGQEGMIAEEIAPGYRRGDQLLKIAKVKVFKGN